jgi:3-deoxy-7-phosphoheptulonate synthase
MLKNEYILKLKEQNKLNISIDRDKEFTFPLGDVTVGKDLIIIAGPCSVESKDMIIDWANKLAKLNIDALRGGAYKPCTYPITKPIGEWKEGLKDKGLRYLIEARRFSKLPIVSEIMDARHINKLSMDAIDIIQIGTRNFQNYTLLDELGKLDKPILLKRGTWATLDEILGACERIIVGGNDKIMICLRGVVGMPSYRHIFPSTRWAPDILMISALKEFTNIPIIYDPSHSTGYSPFVVPISKAALACGADGLIVECHPNPPMSISDADQAIGIEELK